MCIFFLSPSRGIFACGEVRKQAINHSTAVFGIYGASLNEASGILIFKL